MIYRKKLMNLKLQQAKLNPDAAKCALLMMSILFSPEMINGNPLGYTNLEDEV